MILAFLQYIINYYYDQDYNHCPKITVAQRNHIALFSSFEDYFEYFGLYFSAYLESEALKWNSALQPKQMNLKMVHILLHPYLLLRSVISP